jgi:hypothetical protein
VVIRLKRSIDITLNFKTIFADFNKIVRMKNFLYSNLILQALFQSAHHLNEKREGCVSGPVPLTTDTGPKTYESYRSVSGTLSLTLDFLVAIPV